MSEAFVLAYTAFATESPGEGSLGVVKLADALGAARLTSVVVLLLLPKCPKLDEVGVTQLVPLANQFPDMVEFVVVQFLLLSSIAIAGLLELGIFVRWLILWELFVGMGAAVPFAPVGTLKAGSIMSVEPFHLNSYGNFEESNPTSISPISSPRTQSLMVFE